MRIKQIDIVNGAIFEHKNKHIVIKITNDSWNSYMSVYKSFVSIEYIKPYYKQSSIKVKTIIESYRINNTLRLLYEKT